MGRYDEFNAAMPPVVNLDRTPAAPEYRQRIAGMLSETRMPTEHLQGVSRIVMHDGEHEPSAAMYTRHTQEVFVNHGGKDWRNPEGMARTLVHEIGHHQHFTLNPEQFRASRGPEQESVAENYADHYADGGSSKYDRMARLGFAPWGGDKKADIARYNTIRQAGTLPGGDY